MKNNYMINSLLVTGTIGSLIQCQTSEEIKKPNFLFIITDDQSPFSLKAYGNQICQTPNIDKLASEGITVTSAYVQGSWMSAVSVPSRTQLMTGRNVWRTVGLPGFKTPDYESPVKANEALSPEDPQFYSIPAIFNRAGYITFRTCKSSTSYVNANKLFTYNYEKACTLADDENGSKWHGDRVLDFLEMRESKKQKQPFLIYLGFSHPHDPRHEKEELYAKYGASDEPPAHPDPKSPPLPVNYLPQHPFKHGNDDGRDETRVQGVMTRRDEAVIRNETGREYACIENIDIQIGRVLKKLEEMGELENTCIFFTADNGIAIGRHGLMGKQNLYEHSWRVPLIVKGPGIKKGNRAPGNIYLFDVLPTLCDIAKIEQPPTCDGISFLPVLEGETGTIREVLYGVFNMYKEEGYGGPGNGSRPGIRAVKKGDWKLIKYDVYDGQVHETQLFNLKENPDELLQEHHDTAIIRLTGNKPMPHQVNLANDPKYASILEEMEKLLLKQQFYYNDPFLLWDQKDLLIKVNLEN
jgi:arylsulfatase A-like enzyme